MAVRSDETRDGGPALTDHGRRRTEDRRQRAAEALRENLRRRKAQFRARTGTGRASDEPDENPPG